MGPTTAGPSVAATHGRGLPIGWEIKDPKHRRIVTKLRDVER